ncbi:unnamed protein product [Caenorhabditis bovis]|uniref:Uncharacterized protein n=1 Tax=Caenorhabditis bovis TaxID=2654633 RepID=A0A8S1FE42_9PELO|nr:unnamed protein product [Caenorhabditis bovis]
MHNILKVRDIETLRNSLTGWYIFWSETPTHRVSVFKLFATNGDTARTQKKETLTMRRYSQALLTAWKCLGYIENADRAAPGRENVQLWRDIGLIEKVTQKSLSGKITLKKEALPLDCVETLVKRLTSDLNEAELQSILLLVAVGSLGLRPGSMSENSYSNFEGLLPKDVIVYRVPNAPFDEPHHFRFRVLVGLVHDKTRTDENFEPTFMGLSHPVVKADGTENWGLTGAAGWVFQLILGGHIDVTSLLEWKCTTERRVSWEKNREMPIWLRPKPGNSGELTREKATNLNGLMKYALDKFKLPNSLFTMKSLRQGYATSLVNNVAVSQEAQAIMDTRMVHEALTSCPNWRSGQARNYINGLVSSVQEQPSSVIGFTANDWLAASLRNSASNIVLNSNYEFKTTGEIRNECKLADEKPNVRCLKRLRDLTNTMAFLDSKKSGTPRPAESDDIVGKSEDKHWNNNNDDNDVLNMVRCVQQLNAASLANDVPFKDILEHALVQQWNRFEPILCPISSCRMEFKKDGENRWLLHYQNEHEKKKNSLLYLCPCRQSNHPLVLKTMRAHARKEHMESSCRNKFQLKFI